MEQRRNARAGEAGDPRENPPTRGDVRHASHLRKSGLRVGRHLYATSRYRTPVPATPGRWASTVARQEFWRPASVLDAENSADTTDTGVSHHSLAACLAPYTRTWRLPLHKLRYSRVPPLAINYPSHLTQFVPLRLRPHVRDFTLSQNRHWRQPVSDDAGHNPMVIEVKRQRSVLAIHFPGKTGQTQREFSLMKGAGGASSRSPTQERATFHFLGGISRVRVVVAWPHHTRKNIQRKYPTYIVVFVSRSTQFYFADLSHNMGWTQYCILNYVLSIINEPHIDDVASTHYKAHIVADTRSVTTRMSPSAKTRTYGTVDCGALSWSRFHAERSVKSRTCGLSPTLYRVHATARGAVVHRSDTMRELWEGVRGVGLNVSTTAGSLEMEKAAQGSRNRVGIGQTGTGHESAEQEQGMNRPSRNRA
ncbi:hypothetical protein PR048_026236 [Dryococelus australis]|uniref:Uncharacterized protein n=1 Tax=Dryococelus australis TaxID=614101 RepID=A0ABQ9GKR9_9NEOP|nr:hypothetical protein PR048_026236 [Dryococelus australis]